MTRVCRRFNDIAAPILYRDINLGTLERARRCCDTLLDGPPAHADYVRSFVIFPIYSCRRDHPNDMINYSRLSQALRIMPRLGHLHLWIPAEDDRLFWNFDSLDIPNLRRFGINQPGFRSEAILSKFLARHAALTHLEIIRPFKLLEIDPKFAAKVRLPQLQSYRGSATYFMRLVVAKGCLTHAEFWDIPGETDLHGLFVYLSAAMNPNVPFSLKLLSDVLTVELLLALSRWLPNIQTLELGPFTGLAFSVYHWERHLVKVLEPLKHLIVFNISSGCNVHNNRTVYRPWLQELASVREWGECCPSLKVSRIHDREWVRAEDGAWITL